MTLSFVVRFLLFPFSERKSLLGEEGMAEYQPGALYLFSITPYKRKKGFERSYTVVLINQTPFSSVSFLIGRLTA